jgi:hypothetical protein
MAFFYSQMCPAYNRTSLYLADGYELGTRVFSLPSYPGRDHLSPAVEFVRRTKRRGGMRRSADSPRHCGSRLFLAGAYRPVVLAPSSSPQLYSGENIEGAWAG